MPPEVPAVDAVLVIERDHTTRLALSELVREQGYDPIEAKNAREALDLLMGESESLPVFIIVSSDIPEMTGWELLGVLRSYHRLASVPVLVISSLEPPADVLSAGDVAHLLNAEARDELVRTMTSLIARGGASSRPS